MAIRLVAFDLDGTLIDSSTDLAQAANLLLARHGAGPLSEAEVVGMVGEGARVLVERVFAAAALPPPTPADHAAFVEIYDAHLFDHTQAYPGASETLHALAAHVPAPVLALVTNKPLGPSRRLLAHFGWSAHFAHVYGGDAPLPRKPAPDGLRDAMARAGASAEDTVLVGDSHVDAATARAAGVRFCFARYGFGAARVPAAALAAGDWQLDALPALVDLVANRGREIVQK